MIVIKEPSQSADKPNITPTSCYCPNLSLSYWNVWPCEFDLAEYVLAVFDQVVEINGKQTIYDVIPMCHWTREQLPLEESELSPVIFRLNESNTTNAPQQFLSVFLKKIDFFCFQI